MNTIVSDDIDVAIVSNALESILRYNPVHSTGFALDQARVYIISLSGAGFPSQVSVTPDITQIPWFTAHVVHHRVDKNKVWGRRVSATSSRTLHRFDEKC